jgi:hypothetical protein
MYAAAGSSRFQELEPVSLGSVVKYGTIRSVVYSFKLSYEALVMEVGCQKADPINYCLYLEIFLSFLPIPTTQPLVYTLGVA